MAYLTQKERFANHKNPKAANTRLRRFRRNLRATIIKEYGGKCKVCGIIDPEVLEIDHINNNGKEHRKDGISGYKMYQFLKNNSFPKDEYQLLCKNCNWKKWVKVRESRLI